MQVRVLAGEDTLALLVTLLPQYRKRPGAPYEGLAGCSRQLPESVVSNGRVSDSTSCLGPSNGQIGSESAIIGGLQMSRACVLWLLTATLAVIGVPSVFAPKPAEGRDWLQLFNGRNLDGWVPKSRAIRWARTLATRSAPRMVC